MKRSPVESSSLASVGYDPDTRIPEIEFRNGSVYQYSEVPASAHAALMSADSHGKYFSRHIRQSFRYREL